CMPRNSRRQKAEAKSRSTTHSFSRWPTRRRNRPSVRAAVTVLLAVACATRPTVMPRAVEPAPEPPWPVHLRVFDRRPSGEVVQVGEVQTGDTNVALPSGRSWFIEPTAPSLTDPQLEALGTKMHRHGVPGLSLRGLGAINGAKLAHL